MKNSSTIKYLFILAVLELFISGGLMFCSTFLIICYGVYRVLMHMDLEITPPEKSEKDPEVIS